MSPFVPPHLLESLYLSSLSRCSQSLLMAPRGGAANPIAQPSLSYRERLSILVLRPPNPIHNPCIATPSHPFPSCAWDPSLWKVGKERESLRLECQLERGLSGLGGRGRGKKGRATLPGQRTQAQKSKTDKSCLATRSLPQRCRGYIRFPRWTASRVSAHRRALHSGH